MNAVAEPLSSTIAEEAPCEVSFSCGSEPTVLSDIYQKHINLAVWEREFDADLTNDIEQFIAVNPNLKKSLNLSPENALEGLEFAFGDTASSALLEDIAQLIDMYCYLFELESAGLRLAVLDKAMCPRFHIDQVPCRLVTTYQGTATQWLDNQSVDRSKLGRGSNGQPDALSGLYHSENDVKQLTNGDVALLKGERWEGNEGAGLVHRSPSNLEDGPRLLLTLDFG